MRKMKTAQKARISVCPFGGELSVPVGGEHVYTCPAAGTTPDITISYADAEHRPSMTVVEPQLVVTTNATGIGSFWPGDVVMGTLRTVNCIGPMTVSFRGEVTNTQ